MRQRDTTTNSKTAEIRHSQIPRHCGHETDCAPQVQNRRNCSCGAHDRHPRHTKHALSEATWPLRARLASLSITQRSQPGNHWPNYFTENAQRRQTATICPNSFTENAVSEAAMTSTGQMTSLSQLSEVTRPPHAQPTSPSHLSDATRPPPGQPLRQTNPVAPHRDDWNAIG
ncbi:hypothetical protein BREU_2134 [Bifidobacterium reuteri DSM 23975]|uniref:Uncharacterized protein n=1 Tax=Bifidobacterium reuteri DSM 23975 TaxID=1437610 RepID=A0A087CKZ9_9BIFI|nr:hypothetical protein BREU_2134 [Bifidobacterium reuteri DSM 23975]